MPVTPDFSVSQDDAAVVVRIRVPHVRVSEAEVRTSARRLQITPGLPTCIYWTERLHLHCSPVRVVRDVYNY